MMLATNASTKAIATPASTRSHHAWSQSSGGRKCLPMAMRNDRNMFAKYHDAHVVVKSESCRFVEKGS
jgi:hypothetical protein